MFRPVRRLSLQSSGHRYLAPDSLPCGSLFRDVIVFLRFLEDCTRRPLLVYSLFSLNLSVSIATSLNNANSCMPSRCQCCYYHLASYTLTRLPVVRADRSDLGGSEPARKDLLLSCRWSGCHVLRRRRQCELLWPLICRPEANGNRLPTWGAPHQRGEGCSPQGGNHNWRRRRYSGGGGR